MSSAIFTLLVHNVDLARAAVTFKVQSTQSARQMAVSRYFVLRTLALNGHDNHAISRRLSALTRSLARPECDRYLTNRETVDRFILRTRITALENYIDWENIDHHDALARMLAVMHLPTSYHLEVHFADPAHLEGIAVGDRLESYHADGWIDGIEALLAADPDNLYTFKGNDEQWRLSRFLPDIAWTNAEHSITRLTDGLIPWLDGQRWGAVDSDGRMIVPCTHDDIGFQNGRLCFRTGDRWRSIAELDRA